MFGGLAISTGTNNSYQWYQWSSDIAAGPRVVALLRIIRASDDQWWTSDDSKMRSVVWLPDIETTSDTSDPVV